jgi:hypothetical protein
LAEVIGGGHAICHQQGNYEPIDRKSQERKITFNVENNQAGQSIYLCHRNDPDDYTEIGSVNLLEELRKYPATQIPDNRLNCSTPQGQDQCGMPPIYKRRIS